MNGLWLDQWPSSDIDKLAAAYASAHADIGGILPDDVARAVCAEFTDLDDPVWLANGCRYTNSFADKPDTRSAIECLLAPPFLAVLERLTGINNLMGDFTLGGGGLNVVPTGSWLELHADFNYLNKLRIYSAINVLIYLNEGWRAEDGGCLELWGYDVAGPPVVVVPSLNRAGIFTTHSKVFCDYRPVCESNGSPRRSINLYYYRHDPLPNTLKAPHKTICRSFPDVPKPDRESSHAIIEH